MAKDILKNLGGLVGNLPGPLGSLGKITGLFSLPKNEVDKVLAKGKHLTIDRLKKDGWDPAVKANGSALERQLIRATMYLIFKHGIIEFNQSLRPIASYGADILRDTYDDKVVELVMPELDPTDTVDQMEELVRKKIIEQMF